MASTQFVISNPGNMVPGTVLTTLPQAVVPSEAQMKVKEQASIKLFEQVWVAFHTIGSACILLCFGDLVAGIVGLIYGSAITISFSWAWGGFLFGIINGSLVLRAVKNKPQIDLHWANVSFGFGITSIVIHFIDLIMAALGSGIYGHSYSTTSYYDSYYSSNSFAYYYKYSPINAETTRLVLLLLLVSLEIWQVTLGGKLRRHFASQRIPPPVSYTVLTVTQPAPIIEQQQVAFVPNVDGYNMQAATMPPPPYQVSFNQVPVAATPGAM